MPNDGAPVVFGKHLPPSAGVPRVLALDDQAAAGMAGLAQVTLAQPADDLAESSFDAIAGSAAPDQVRVLVQRLRPGGRLILTHAAGSEALLAALTQAGLIHCLVEPHGPFTLYRGERPPQGTPIERLHALAAEAPSTSTRPNYDLPITSYSSLKTPSIFLLVTQTPHKPAWKLAPGERVAWRAATVLPAAGEQPVLLAFSALVKAVAFMQSAVMAQTLSGVNKVGKFPVAAAQSWTLPLTVNPAFDAVRDFAPGPPLEVDPQTAVTGDE